MMLLIGIDDTDNKESRGTGYLSRQLAHRLEGQKLGLVKGITRHQLYVHPSIAYTSQNSSACLVLETGRENEVTIFCSNYLKQEAAQGSDAGLCIAREDKIDEEVMEWGIAAKREVLQLDEAVNLARKHSIYLQGFMGELIGQIGALAAVGLRRTGNDGRFIWMQGIRELRDFDSGIYTVNDLIWNTGIEMVQTMEGKLVPGNQKVYCDGWTRPVIKNHLAILLVEKVNFADYDWKTIAKDHIRTIS